MELFEHEESAHAPRKFGWALLTGFLGFLVPALIGILAVFLGS